MLAYNIYGGFFLECNDNSLIPIGNPFFWQLIASGPFTTTDNLMFEPLTELLAYASRKLPQLLMLVRYPISFTFNVIICKFTSQENTVLLTYYSRFSQLGPFVDSEHPEIKKGTVDGSFDEIFRLEILRRVSAEMVVFCI